MSVFLYNTGGVRMIFAMAGSMLEKGRGLCDESPHLGDRRRWLEPCRQGLPEAAHHCVAPPVLYKKVLYKKSHCLESENLLLWLALWFGGTA